MKYTPTASGAKVTSQLVAGALMGGSDFRMGSAAPDKKRKEKKKKEKQHLQHFQLVPRRVAQFYLPYYQPEMTKAHCLMFSYREGLADFFFFSQTQMWTVQLLSYLYIM